MRIMILATIAALAALTLVINHPDARADFNPQLPDATHVWNLDPPYVVSPVRLCVRNVSSVGLDVNYWRSTFLSWLATPQLGWAGDMAIVSWADGGSACETAHLVVEFRDDPGMIPAPGEPVAEGLWPVEPAGETYQYGPTRWDGKQHLTRAGLAMRASTWLGKTTVGQQFQLFHETGHALSISHEGPAMGTTGFGKAPFTHYDTCENYNCLASYYDVADYDNWSYDPVLNQGAFLGIVNSHTSKTDRTSISAGYSDRAAQPFHTCLDNFSPGALRTSGIDTTRTNISNWAYYYRWSGTGWIYLGGAWVTLTGNPPFGERMIANFAIGDTAGFYITGLISYKQSTGWNYSEPINWSEMIWVPGASNNNSNPPCGLMPSRVQSNVSYISWLKPSQQVSYTLLEFRALTGHSTITGGSQTWTFVTTVNDPSTEVWHWFPSNPPNTARFVYRMKSVNWAFQSAWSKWVLVEPWDTGNQ